MDIAEKGLPGLTLKDSEDWDIVLNRNLKGQYYAAESVLPTMKQQRWGKIVNISSMIGFTGAFSTTPRDASKAGIINMTKLITRQLGPYNINITDVAPGMGDTPMRDNQPKEMFEKAAKFPPP